MTSIITRISLFCLIAFAYSSPIENEFDSAKVYPERCAKGQIVWCKNFKSAAECDAVNHCIQNVWLNMKQVADDDSSKSCVTTVDSIRENIDSNTTKEVLKETFEAVCHILPWTVPFHKICEQILDTYVDEYFNELLDFLKSDVDSKTICSILFFCETWSSISANVIEDDAVIRYKNVILHLPARFINREEAPKLLGNEKCTWGPSYWCDNISSSKECKMTSHCIKSVWSKTHYDEDNDSVCEICKDMVKQARDQLQSNKTREELKEVFEGSCKLISIKDIQEECIKLADEFVPELTDMIVEQLNPTAICTVSGLCNSDRIDNLLAGATSASYKQVSDSCINCTIAFTAVERFLKNSPHEDVIDKLLRICGQLSSYSDVCSTLVVTHFEDLYTMMKNQLQPFTACHLSGMCAYKYHFHPSQEDLSFQSKVNIALATSNDDLPCDLCKQLLTHFKDILVANTTEEEFLQVLRGICTQTGKFKAECLQIVNEDFKIIYKFLSEELNPAEICREVNLCPNGKAITDESLNLISSRVVLQTPFSNQIASLVPAKTQFAVECRFCKMIVREIQSEMKKPEYEHDIEKAIEKVCTLVPFSDKTNCDMFVDHYAEVLVKMLADQTDPGVICSMLGLCENVPAKKVTGNELCSLCQSIMHYVQVELEDPKEEERIKQTLEKVCAYLPSSERAACNRFISQYSALIIVILAQELDPTLVCPALKVCPALLSAEDRCEHCQILLNDFIDRFEGNRDEKNIKNKLEKFGPPTVRGNATLVAVELKFSHYEEIVETMVAGFDGEETCTYLKFCDAKTVTPVATTTNEITEIGSLTMNAQAAVEKPSCEICELFVQMYEDKLTSNVTEHELEIVFLKYCDEIEVPEFKLNCSRVVDKYLPLLMNLLKRDVKPKDLCGLAKLCPLRATNTFSLESMQECRVCEVVVGALQSVNEDPYVEGSTTTEIGKICEMIGKQERNACSTIVNELAPQIENIVNGIPSWYYCAKLDMCPYREHLIDLSVCSKSESWCEDLKTAVVCDKLKHCQQTVWKSERPIRN